MPSTAKSTVQAGEITVSKLGSQDCQLRHHTVCIDRTMADVCSYDIANSAYKVNKVSNII